MVGDVAKLDICLSAFYGLFVLMRQQTVNSVITYFVCSLSSVCVDYYVCRFTPASCQLLLPDHLIAGFVTCRKPHDYTIVLFTYSTRATAASSSICDGILGKDLSSLLKMPLASGLKKPRRKIIESW